MIFKHRIITYYRQLKHLVYFNNHLKEEFRQGILKDKLLMFYKLWRPKWDATKTLLSRFVWNSRSLTCISKINGFENFYMNVSCPFELLQIVKWHSYDETKWSSLLILFNERQWWKRFFWPIEIGLRLQRCQVLGQS